MTFEDCLMECIGNNELVKEFNRLNGSHIGERRSGIEKAIDGACRYDPDKDAFPDFIAFVYDCIWCPLVQSSTYPLRPHD